MPNTPLTGLPYPAPGDAPEGDAQIAALATALDPRVGLRAWAGRVTVTPNANGIVSFPHGCGTAAIAAVAVPLGANNGNPAVINAVQFVTATASTLTMKVFVPAGTPYTAGAVTLLVIAVPETT